jgi:hypothetical protein
VVILFSEYKAKMNQLIPIRKKRSHKSESVAQNPGPTLRIVVQILKFRSVDGRKLKFVGMNAC